MKAQDMFDLTGKVVLVTGAASGLGLAMSEVALDHGARVVMADIDAGGLAREAARLRDAGHPIEHEALDIGDIDRVRAVVDAAAERHGRLDVLFANAGVSSGPGYLSEQGRIENVDVALFDRSLHINVTGTFACMQAAARHMKTRGEGSIVVTASVAALVTSGLPGHGYFAGKAGVAHLVKLTAKELAPFGIRVNGIAPGPFVTNIAGGRMKDPEAARKFAETVPLGRLAQPDEIKGLALFLASSASSYVTGAVIPIDGGTAA